jgi:uncharacterized protein YkwD
VNIQSSVLDLLAIILLAWWAYEGYRRGLVLTVFDTVLRAMTLAGVAVWSGPISAYLTGRWHLPSDVSTVGAIAFVVMSLEVVRRLGASGLRGSAEALHRDLPNWRYVDRLAGLGTGLARGSVTLTLVIVALLILPVGPTVQSPVRQSYAAQAISLLWPAVVETTAAAITGDETVRSALRATSASQDLRVATPTLGARPPDATSNPDEERQFLSMTNLARSQAGASALTIDPGLTAAARQHSLDMVTRAYFAHESPTGTSPSDRIRAAAVPFRQVAENIVFAPTVEDAFQSIMASPEHRTNQLSLDYNRVGIGVVQTAAGVIITEDFAD